MVGSTIGIYLLGILIVVSKITGYEVAIGVGKSMCPTQGQMGLILVKKIKNIDEIEIGEIYSYRSVYTFNHSVYEPGDLGYVSHRLVQRSGDILIFKGDNNGYYEHVPQAALDSKELYSLTLIPCMEDDK